MLHDDHALTTAVQNVDIATHQIPAILAAARKIATDTPYLIELFVQRVEVRNDGITITLTLASLMPAEKAAATITHVIAMQMKRRGVELRLVVGGNNNPARTDATLITAIARAHQWFQRLATGQAKNIADIATREGIDRSYATRILNLAFLAPDIVVCIIAGQ